MSKMRSLLLLLLLLLLTLFSLPAMAGGKTLMSNVTAVSVGQAYFIPDANRAYQATETGTGTISATVLVQASNDGVGWITLGTITLSGTAVASDGFAALAPWMEVRGDVTAISGTGAAITLTVGAQ